ncbi:putative secreted protein, SVM family protein [Candidatus Phytoplasma solani]|uniref:SVM family protein n=1 Tax=Candidatus Phytoplasma solani TaxID=69896 RepID=UPI0032DA8FDA
MFKIKNNLLFLNLFLFIGLGLFLINNNVQVIAMNQNDSEASGSNPVNYNLNEKEINTSKIPEKLNFISQHFKYLNKQQKKRFQKITINNKIKKNKEIIKKEIKFNLNTIPEDEKL